MIENLDSLNVLVTYLTSHISHPKIIWDPILKASAGFDFHKNVDIALLETICKQLFLVTPNIPEAMILGKKDDAIENARELSGFCHVFLKGGHAENKTGHDTLFLKGGKQLSFRPKAKGIYPKHGSGCVLSSAITANLAKDEELHRACLKAKQYTEKFLRSNKTLLGYHKL